MGVSRSLQWQGCDRDLAHVPDTAVQAHGTESQRPGAAPGSAPCCSEDTGLTLPPPSIQRTAYLLSFLPATFKAQAPSVFKLKEKAQDQPSVCGSWKHRASQRQRTKPSTVRSCYGLSVCVPPPHIHMLKPNPKVMVLVGGASGRRLGHECGALMNGINALIKETPQCSQVPPAMWGQTMKSATRERALTRPCWHLDLWLPASRTNHERKCLLFISHPVCGILL